MEKLLLTQNELCEYGMVCELSRLVYWTKDMIENCDIFPEELWDVNDKLLEALSEAHSEYMKYLRSIEEV